MNKKFVALLLVATLALTMTLTTGCRNQADQMTHTPQLVSPDK